MLRIAVALAFFVGWRSLCAQEVPETVATPLLSNIIAGSTVPFVITVSDATPGAKIYYTLDGSLPTPYSTSIQSGQGILIKKSETVLVQAYADGYNPSETASGTYQIIGSRGGQTYTGPPTLTRPGISAEGNNFADRGTTQGSGIQNSLPDWWQLKYFGRVGLNPNVVLTGKGLTLLEDYREGNDPTYFYSQGGRNLIPKITMISGSDQTSDKGAFTNQPLIVLVTKQDGTPLVHAPVTFAVASGGGAVAGPTPETLGAIYSLLTDREGKAQVYFQHPSEYRVTSRITASAAAQSVTFVEMTTAGDGKFDPISDIKVTNVSLTELDLSWVNHASEATSIIIQQSTNDGQTWKTIATLTDPTSTSYAVTNLSPGIPYAFQLYDNKP